MQTSDPSLPHVIRIDCREQAAPFQPRRDDAEPPRSPIPAHHFGLFGSAFFYTGVIPQLLSLARWVTHAVSGSPCHKTCDPSSRLLDQHPLAPPGTRSSCLRTTPATSHASAMWRDRTNLYGATYVQNAFVALAPANPSIATYPTASPMRTTRKNAPNTDPGYQATMPWPIASPAQAPPRRTAGVSCPPELSRTMAMP